MAGNKSDWRDYEFHPLANEFGLIEGADFDDLAADIKLRGRRDRSGHRAASVEQAARGRPQAGPARLIITTGWR